MSAPLCPIHNVPMKESQFGGYFCTQPLAGGKNGRCDQKAAGPPRVAPVAQPMPMRAGAAPATVGVSGAAPAPSGELLAASALLSAALLCKGGGPDFEQAVTVMAQRMVAAMRAMI